MQRTTSEVIGGMPPERPCEFCGNPQKSRYVYPESDRTRAFFVGYEACGCEGAMAKLREQAAAEEREREEARAVAHAAMLERAGIPARYRKATHPLATALAEQAMGGRGTYVHGGNGAGKTHLAMAAALILLECGRKTFCVPSYELMDAMRSRKDEDRGLYERAVSCEVLVLDDLGKEASNTPYACERLFAIIDKRDRGLLPTIITSNYKLMHLAQHISDGEIGLAIASRIAGSCESMLLNEADRRLNRD